MDLVANLKPLGDGILVERIDDEIPITQVILVRNDESISDAVEGDYRRLGVKSRVIAVGPGRWVHKERSDSVFHPTQVKVGQIVLHTNWNDGEMLPKPYQLIQERDVYGTIPG